MQYINHRITTSPPALLNIFSQICLWKIWSWPISATNWVFAVWSEIFWPHKIKIVQSSITIQSRRSWWENTDPTRSRGSNRSWVRLCSVWLVISMVWRQLSFNLLYTHRVHCLKTIVPQFIDIDNFRIVRTQLSLSILTFSISFISRSSNIDAFFIIWTQWPL